MSIILVILLLPTALWDLYKRRVSNLWIFSVWVFGILILLVWGNLPLIFLSLVTSMSLLVFGMILWWMRIIGGADAKLFSWVGLFLGYPDGFIALGFIMVTGGVLALLYLTRPALYDFQMKSKTVSYQVMPYVPAIFLGALLYLLQKS